MATHNNPEFSIIIPVANEGAALPECLWRIERGPSEIVVVDGGSEDASRAIAEEAGCRVISLPEPHRARQMNCGAASARGQILLFLHADTWLPDRALDRIRAALDQRHVLGGGFARRYRSPSLILALTSRLAGLRNRVVGWHLGDQALFVRADAFKRLGGFRDIPIFEDLDFSRRLRDLGRTVSLTPPVSSSARRFTARGPLRTTWEDLLLTRKYLLGTDPNDLCQAPPDRLKTLQAYERLS
ncbi:MAG: TIGR04283 family arsenosugar biosynthesis glycosyltransferase [Chthoniobacterales bacterium]|nr:TIGR04283 family arsenosugar biosynthesis glycosyltransferase [Chthoniobacterales bacterium]